MRIADVLADQMDTTRDWTLKLLADLDGDDWSFQPAPGMGHATWLAGHIAVAQHLLIHERCAGNGILPDSFCGHFPIGAPVVACADHDYPPIEDIRRAMDQTHAASLEAVRKMDDASLAEPAFGKDGAPHPHYTDKLGAISHCFRHEAFHAGQIANIRRLLGKPFLR
jgi:uncharacterized damage-inducible protein DinB